MKRHKFKRQQEPDRCKQPDCNDFARHKMTIKNREYHQQIDIDRCCRHYDDALVLVLREIHEGNEEAFNKDLRERRFIHAVNCNYMPSRGVCDFCTPAMPAVWEYACASFRLPDEVGLPPMQSNGAWLACDRCAAFIERDELDKLALLVPEEAVSRQCQIIGLFIEHRSGPRKAFA